MKTKLFFAACLLFCLALPQAQAQNGKNGTGSVSSWTVEVPFLFRIEIGGELIDEIYGFMPYHEIKHYDGGVWMEYRGMGHGVLTGGITGKTYKISSILQPLESEWIWCEGDFPWTTEVEDGYYVLDPMGYGMDHLICDDGTVYIIRYTYSVLDIIKGGTGFTNYEIRVAGKK